MSPSPRNPVVRTCDRRAAARRPALTPRAGFTLVELIFTMSILSFSAAVFGGLIMAISSAWDHSTALEDSRRQSQGTLGRIKWMVQQAGTYRLTGQSTTLGLAVVSTDTGVYQAPTTLVVWSGGANGGLNAQGLLTRLPVASEVVVYAPDPSTPARFVEVTFPANTTVVDFRSGTFSTTIQSLLKLSTAQKILLCDRLHTSAGKTGTTINLGDARFELSAAPTDSQIAGVTVGSQAWNDLPWGQCLVGADRGLRTSNIRIELLLDPNPKKLTTDSGYSTSLPFLGSVNRQYVFQP